MTPKNSKIKSRTLHLSVNKKTFEAIASGELLQHSVISSPYFQALLYHENGTRINYDVLTFRNQDRFLTAIFDGFDTVNTNSNQSENGDYILYFNSIIQRGGFNVQD